MKNKKLIIFDLDGTLINTVKDLNIAVNYALKQYNYPLRSVEQTTADIGNGVAKLIERSIPNGIDNENYTTCLAVFKEYYKAHYFENSFPYSEVKDVLAKLKEKGYLLAVVSNKFDEGAKKLINFYLPNIFDRVQGSVPELRYKPASDLVFKVLKELNVSKEDTLYVGDTNVDYETAMNSNVDCVLVSYGYRSESYLKEHTKNSPIISNLSELLLVIE